jgi:hypothetical protein
VDENIMDTERAKGRTVSAAAREKCIKQARKQVESEEKWGRWSVTLDFVFAMAFWTISGGFILIVYAVVQTLVAPAGQQAQNAVWEGFALGSLFGFIAGATFFKGAFWFARGVGSLRGDPVSRTLVEYHDALIHLMHEETDPLLGSAAEQPQRPAGPNRCNG